MNFLSPFKCTKGMLLVDATKHGHSSGSYGKCEMFGSLTKTQPWTHAQVVCIQILQVSILSAHLVINNTEGSTSMAQRGGEGV